MELVQGMEETGVTVEPQGVGEVLKEGMDGHQQYGVVQRDKLGL